MSFLREKDVILFQGDSITDSDRDRDNPASLGGGYPLLIAARLSALYAGRDFTFINKSVSGDRVRDLETRWTTDCVELRPTVVSILIGINDTWRRYDSDDPTSTEVFAAAYRRILERTVNETEARLILLEPFVLPVWEEQHQWREDLDPKIQAVRALAREFGARYIPLDGLFASVCTQKSPEYWAHDGIHPTCAGHGYIAEAWIDEVKSV